MSDSYAPRSGGRARAASCLGEGGGRSRSPDSGLPSGIFTLLLIHSKNGILLCLSSSRMSCEGAIRTARISLRP